MWNEIWEVVRQEFADVPDAGELTRLLVRLGLAMLLGAAIGYERESRDSSAGLRTHMLVALGTAIFVLVPLQAGMNADGMSRVIQGLIAGIGFLGAGTVIKHSHSGEIHGLTTAAGIWATAAIGMTVGMGRETTAIISTVFVLVILSVLLRLERYIVPETEGRDDVSPEEKRREHDS